MRRPVWMLIVAAALVLSQLAVTGCSRKSVESEGPTTDVVKPPATDTNPPETTKPTDGPESSQDETGFTYKDVYFAYDDATLSEEARGVLSRTGAHMSKNDVRVEVQGNCDERGSVEYNLALGERRANSVKEYLVSYGVGGNRLTTVSFGKEKPVDQGHDESAWAKNRRAHFVVR
ncbi:MAG: peptidoglycan-associated lipoprotein Pal [Candidatus Eisenbacteria bacterium]|nr:peptidoglycan-associated lipoprotein Pal [Candidatus Eisenbacteria bacterium]